MPTPTQHNKKLNAFLYNAFLLDTSEFGEEEKSVLILTLDTSKKNHYKRKSQHENGKLMLKYC